MNCTKVYKVLGFIILFIVLFTITLTLFYTPSIIYCNALYKCKSFPWALINYTLISFIFYLLLIVSGAILIVFIFAIVACTMKILQFYCPDYYHFEEVDSNV